MLHQLLHPTHKELSRYDITALVRGTDKAKIFHDHGIKTALFDGLENTAQIKEIASNYDSKSFRSPMGGGSLTYN